jgi:hypothetical protein
MAQLVSSEIGEDQLQEDMACLSVEQSAAEKAAAKKREKKKRNKANKKKGGAGGAAAEDNDQEDEDEPTTTKTVAEAAGVVPGTQLTMDQLRVLSQRTKKGKKDVDTKVIID